MTNSHSSLDKLLEDVYTRGYEDGYEDGEFCVVDTPGHVEWSFESFMSDFKSTEAYNCILKKLRT